MKILMNKIDYNKLHKTILKYIKISSIQNSKYIIKYIIIDNNFEINPDICNKSYISKYGYFHFPEILLILDDQFNTIVQTIMREINARNTKTT